MTPDEARALLDGTTPGPWLSDLDRNSDEPSGIYAVAAQGGELSARLVAEDISEEADTALIAAAPSMAAMIAGMREEWVGQYLDREGKWATICARPTREEVAHHLDQWGWDAYTHTRIVRRYVTEPEEA